MIDIASVLLSLGMVFGPVIGYIDQYRLIYKDGTSAGFNPKTCAILLFANILRIFFWFGERFDTTLLVQSIVMILSQLILLEIVVRYRPTLSWIDEHRRNSNSSRSSASSLSIEADHPWHRAWQKRHLFWQWSTYLEYLNFLLAFTTIIALLYIFMNRLPFFIDLLGIISLGIESTLPLPQCISNYKRRSTDGFSLLVLASWFLGDGFKVFYYIYTKAPFQFIGCGIVQLTIDSVIVLQCILFSSVVKKWLGISSSPLFLDRSDYEPIE
ncbi:PQ loop repeat-domain-containing protein [Chlamydoabsidia padenii]|nr:PQ loop repeat-domain-containing protein [Chlamydoabsidia padenii]